MNKGSPPESLSLSSSLHSLVSLHSEGTEEGVLPKVFVRIDALEIGLRLRFACVICENVLYI